MSKNLVWLSCGLPLRLIASIGMWMHLHWESLVPYVWVVLRNHYGILLGIFLLSVGILESNEVEPRVVVKAIELL